MIFLIAIAFKAFDVLFKPLNGKLFGTEKLRKLKVSWALPTPTTFKRLTKLL